MLLSRETPWGMFELNRETPWRTLISTWRGGLEAREFPRKCQTLNVSVAFFASEREREPVCWQRLGAGEVQSLLIEVLGSAWLIEPLFCKGLQWLVIDKPYKNNSNNSLYLILVFLHFLYIAFGQCAALINKHTPSNEGMKLQNCYQAQNNSRSLLPMVT